MRRFTSPFPRPRFTAEIAESNGEPKSDAETPIEVSMKLESPPMAARPKPGTISEQGLSTDEDWSAARPPQTAHGASPDHYNYLKALAGLIGLSPYTEGEVLTFLRGTVRCDESLASLAEVAEKSPDTIHWAHDHWNSVEEGLAQLRKGHTP